MSLIVTLSDAKNRLGELAERAAQGEEIIIRRRGKRPVTLVAQTERPETVSQLRERLTEQLGTNHQLNTDKQARLEHLAQKNQAQNLTASERREMLRLLNEFGTLTVARAQALSEMP